METILYLKLVTEIVAMICALYAKDTRFPFCSFPFKIREISLGLEFLKESEASEGMT
uniref:Uncharacterized protein n=1 Tax=Utricularia reniformis TaxID=192314 RepID=A0A1Y0B451_9LAMI|nr:hypothetical protein AEK19_MT2008 [Utricularia reniformis]ART32168.1 hypothetical protein AEK19_MT2008 [Utricularia reniformis]